MLLPGINIMDIGKKMGRDGIDNGAIQCDQLVLVRSTWERLADLSFSISSDRPGSPTFEYRGRT